MLRPAERRHDVVEWPTRRQGQLRRAHRRQPSRGRICGWVLGVLATRLRMTCRVSSTSSGWVSGLLAGPSLAGELNGAGRLAHP